MEDFTRNVWTKTIFIIAIYIHCLPKMHVNYLYDDSMTLFVGIEERLIGLVVENIIDRLQSDCIV